MALLDRFEEIWLVDFEFRSCEGGFPEPVCMVAKELRSQKVIKLWEDQLHHLRKAPFNRGKNSILVAYYASAEIGCFLALGWDLPVNVLDLFAEFRNHTNGFYTPNGAGLLGALAWYGLDSISAAEKESNRNLVLRGNYSQEERDLIIRYCESDVIAMEKLIKVMGNKIPLQALLRGRYMKAVAVIERNGIPIDVPLFSHLKNRWEGIKTGLITEVDRDFGVFEGQTFKRDRFTMWLKHRDISWLTLESGQLALDQDTFKDMARIHPEIEPLHQLRSTLSQMRLSEIVVGPDGRNRNFLSPFRAKTGRNQPSTSKFIFGPAVWLRGFIKPEEGHSLAYIDWEQQEFGIAAALAKDISMIQAYQGGDPYLEFAKMAKAVPIDATKQSHLRERDLFKGVCLAVQYCMGPDSLAARLGITKLEAQDLLNMHKEVFKKFWSWSDAAVDYAMLHNRIFTVFGWEYHITDKPNVRSLRNFPMQANGAEMLRTACCLATERGIKVCAPIHDALLIEAPESEINRTIIAAQTAMREASEIVLSGFPLRSEVKIVVRHPNRYMDERGVFMWNTIMKLLKE